jgi:hypothetical protein
MLPCLTIARHIAAKLQRLHARTELTREMLARSRAQLAKSEELLKAALPKVWQRPGRSDSDSDSEPK